MAGLSQPLPGSPAGAACRSPRLPLTRALAELPWAGQGCWQPCKPREQASKATRLHLKKATRTAAESPRRSALSSVLPSSCSPSQAGPALDQPGWGSWVGGGLMAPRWGWSQRRRTPKSSTKTKSQQPQARIPPTGVPSLPCLRQALWG